MDGLGKGEQERGRKERKGEGNRDSHPLHHKILNPPLISLNFLFFFLNHFF
jgi:hypothetical protein